MSKITRIAYNSADWRKPTGEASKHESAGSYNQQFGFGHEDWLFRYEWLIDGWRYTFIQGINRSHANLVKAGTPVDLTLFTIQTDKRRRIVATINSVECLDDQQAEDALEIFKTQSWYGTMLKEIDGVGETVQLWVIPSLLDTYSTCAIVWRTCSLHHPILISRHPIRSYIGRGTSYTITTKVVRHPALPRNKVEQVQKLHYLLNLLRGVPRHLLYVRPSMRGCRKSLWVSCVWNIQKRKSCANRILST